jgi:hypothetical protein
MILEKSLSQLKVCKNLILSGSIDKTITIEINKIITATIRFLIKRKNKNNALTRPIVGPLPNVKKKVSSPADTETPKNIRFSP